MVIMNNYGDKIHINDIPSETLKRTIEAINLRVKRLETEISITSCILEKGLLNEEMDRLKKKSANIYKTVRGRRQTSITFHTPAEQLKIT